MENELMLSETRERIILWPFLFFCSISFTLSLFTNSIELCLVLQCKFRSSSFVSANSKKSQNENGEITEEHIDNF